jgi:Na+/H+-dicarboxylate symporter
MIKKMGPSITHQILLATLTSILLGSLIHSFFDPESQAHELIVHGILDLGGQLFLNSLKMLVIPLIFFSLSTGVAGIRDAKQLGKMGFQTLVFFLVTTILALVIGLTLSSQVDFAFAGKEFTPNPDSHRTQSTSIQNSSIKAPSLKQTLTSLIPANPIKAMADGETLQVIVFALLFGWALSQNKKVGPSLLLTFEKINTVLLDMILILVKAAPIGVFCLLTKTFSELGLSTLLPLAKYFFTLTLILLLHGYGVYSLILKYWIRVSPLHFFKKFAPVQIFAFSTSSSNATLPITLEVTEKELGVSNRVAAFVIPLGATLNMNGTSIMQAVATVFIAKVYGIELTFSQYIVVVATATLTAIGTAGVPGVGMVMLAMVLQQVNLPVEGIGLILGVDRLLDMIRTSVNVTGDAIAALWVAKSQNPKDWDESVFYTHPHPQVKP